MDDRTRQRRASFKRDCDRVAKYAIAEGMTLKEALNLVSAAIVRRALNEDSGVHAHASKRLGYTREGLYLVRKKVGVE